MRKTVNDFNLTKRAPRTAPWRKVFSSVSWGETARKSDKPTSSPLQINKGKEDTGAALREFRGGGTCVQGRGLRGAPCHRSLLVSAVSAVGPVSGWTSCWAYLSGPWGLWLFLKSLVLGTCLQLWNPPTQESSASWCRPLRRPLCPHFWVPPQNCLSQTVQLCRSFLSASPPATCRLLETLACTYMTPPSLVSCLLLA